MPCYLNVLSQKKSVDLTSVDHFSIISVMHMTRFCPFCHPFFCVSSDMTSPPLHTGDVMDILKHERTSVGAMLPGVSCFMPYICRGATSWILNSRDEQLGQIPHAGLSKFSHDRSLMTDVAADKASPFAPNYFSYQLHCISSLPYSVADVSAGSNPQLSSLDARVASPWLVFLVVLSSGGHVCSRRWIHLHYLLHFWLLQVLISLPPSLSPPFLP